MRSLFVALFVITCNTCFAQNQRLTYDTNAVRVFDLLYNKPFATLSLEDTGGHLFNTSAIAGKAIYVDFWFTTCPPCIKEIPYSKALECFFAADTNIVFLNICIDNIERKTAWKQMIKAREIKGISLFYARNQPQKISLIKEYLVNFPTYLLVNKEMKVIGYNAPRPSEEGWVHWAIFEAEKSNPLSSAYNELVKQSKKYREFIHNNWQKIISLRVSSNLKQPYN